MQLVIDIPEEEYKWIKKSDKTVFADVASKECMLHAIKIGTPLTEWLNSFDTSSATKCFEAVNILKQRLEGEE